MADGCLLRSEHGTRVCRGNALDRRWKTWSPSAKFVDNSVDARRSGRVAWPSARRGRAQANGSDRINAHAASTFLRALFVPGDTFAGRAGAPTRLSSGP